MFKVDFIGDKAVKWSRKEGGIEAERVENYHPRFYINSDKTKLQRSRPWISSRRNVVATRIEEWQPTLSEQKTRVLRIDVDFDENVMSVVRDLKRNFGTTDFRFFNVGFSPQFRFCLQKGINPVPETDLRKLDLKLHRKYLANKDISNLKIDGRKHGSEKQVLEKLESVFRSKNPDIITVNRGQVLELLNRKLDESDTEFTMGRINRFQKLAGENTVSSYGKTVHSNARYNIPGRVVIDRSNSFLLKDATLEGLWDLVERSYRPIQELAWGSIGRVLTSIEVKKAYLEKNTLTPWKNWDGEKPKKASTMHKADRGGFIFNPEPGVHENVYEADFASLFPNIMVKKNISPETVNCSCCSNNKVPELDYTICENQKGFISEVLKPLVEDRQKMKQEVEELGGEEKENIQGSIDAIKWLLVSCFGYMGHKHASYGAIKCHQAIQAYDREIMIQAKQIFEDNGYRIVHGIIDSIWIKPEEDAEPVEEVCREVTRQIGIELELEHRFEWVAFVPRSSTEAEIATLNRYFGKKEDGDFKTAGIEIEQSSSCQFIKESQKEMIEAFNRNRKTEAAIKVLKEKIEMLENYKIDTEKLVVEKKPSKALEQYSVENRNVAALKRARKHGINMKPGQPVRYVVRNDKGVSGKRVRLDFEAKENEYDPSFYRKQLIRACESVVSPEGISREDIKRRISGSNMSLKASFQKTGKT